jgi:hypothetical protein
MLSEMIRVVRKGGTVAVYVWDYADLMQPIRYFWNAAVILDRIAITTTHKCSDNYNINSNSKLYTII